MANTALARSSQSGAWNSGPSFGFCCFPSTLAGKWIEVQQPGLELVLRPAVPQQWYLIFFFFKNVCVHMCVSDPEIQPLLAPIMNFSYISGPEIQLLLAPTTNSCTHYLSN